MKIFFDVDGVLIDGWHPTSERRKRWDKTLREDLGVDPEGFQQKLFMPLGNSMSLMQACLSGQRDLKEALTATLPEIGYAGSVDAFVAYWFEKDSNVNRDLLSVVTHLARHDEAELYLVTGQEHYRAAYLWHQLRLRDHFRDILYSAKIGHLKSSGEFFARVNSILDVAVGEHPVFFDDQEDVVKMACESGWDACVFDSIDDVLTHPQLRNLLLGL